MRHQRAENADSTSQSKSFVSSHPSIQPTRFIDAVRYARDGVWCNTVIPGMIDRGDTWDVAHAALFLASEEAKHITGTEILVDGDLMARSA